jgi:hypothetical protein
VRVSHIGMKPHHLPPTMLQLPRGASATAPSRAHEPGNARESANLLAERLRNFETRTGGCAHVGERCDGVSAPRKPSISQGQRSVIRYAMTDGRCCPGLPGMDMIPTSRTLWKDARTKARNSMRPNTHLCRRSRPADRPQGIGPRHGMTNRRPNRCMTSQRSAMSRTTRADPPQRAPQDPDAARLHHRPGMSNIIPARVVDMSATGAKMELTPLGRSSGIPMGDLPNQFNLVMRVDRMEVDCEMIWQVDWLIGVRFLSVPRPTHERM